MIGSPERVLALCLIGAAGIVSILAYRRRDREAAARQAPPIPSCRAASWLNRGIRPFVSVAIIASFFYSGPWLATFHDDPAIRWIGVSLALGGISLLVWSFRTLNQQYNPCTRARLPQRIVTTGPYRFFRHPIYVANLVFLLGTCLGTGSLWLAIPGLSFLTVYWIQSRREEEALAREFPEYQEYLERTRWFPRPRRPRTQRNEISSSV